MDTQQPRRRRFNWWMVAFLAAMLAFELAREVAVYEANQPVAGETFNFTRVQGYVSAKGQWFRSDGGGRLLPVGVAIACVEETHTCTEATTVVFDEGIGRLSTDVNTFDAAFTEGTITYINTFPTCVVYRVQIDLSQERVTATRERKQDQSSLCDNMEQRVAMELGDGPQRMIQDTSWLDEHFLPILKLLV